MGEDQIDGQPCGAAFLATGDAISERALTELDAGIPLTDPHSCHRSTLEIIDIKRRVYLGEPVRLKRGDPIAPLERRTSINQEVHAARSSLHHAPILTPHGQTSKDVTSIPG